MTDGLSGLNTGTGPDCWSGVDPECAELLHGLNNVLVGTLLNAQVMEWKLPSYSRLKRNLHEIERNAQRGGELVKRLLKRLSVPPQEQLTSGQSSAQVALPEPDALESGNSDEGTAALSKTPFQEPLVPRVPPYEGMGKRCLTRLCDARTSIAFPKRDNGHAESNEVVCDADHSRIRSKGKRV